MKRVIRLTAIIIKEPPSFKILSNILLARLTPYVDEIIGYHQCGFCRNRPTTNQMLEKKWECNGTVHQIFIDFKKAYDSREKFFAIFCLNVVCLRI
jgi:hypothetical protein